MSHALLTMEEKMYFLKLSVITHVFHSASADAGTLLTGDLIKFLRGRQIQHHFPLTLINLAHVLLFGSQDVCINIVTYFWLGVKRIV